MVEGSKHCKGFALPEEVELLRNAFNKSHKYNAAARATVLLQIVIIVKKVLQVVNSTKTKLVCVSFHVEKICKQ